MSTKIAVAPPGSRPPDVLEDLKSFSRDLAEWLLHASPVTDDDRDLARQLRGLRTRLEQKINEITAARMKLATRSMPAQASRLSVITVEIKGTTKSISTAKDVLHVTGEAVQIAGDILDAITG